jgi:probable F420-dependent oxidoreductase
MVVLDTDTDRARGVARKAMVPYLRAPNYRNNLLRSGFTDDDFADGGSDRLVDAIVACGDTDVVVRRVREHFDAGATHVCVQVLEDDLTAVPESGWAELGAALAEI